MSALTAEIQSLSPSALIELFTIDATNLPGGEVTRFHAGTNGLMQPVIWQGNEYLALPIEAEGFDITTKGTLPRPRLRVANANGMFSAITSEFDDLVGCKIIRSRTFARFLDAANFPDGNPDADPNQHFEDDIWFVEQKLLENPLMIEWELSSAFDLQGVMLPKRQVVQNSCQWKYRGPECGYVGVAYFDKNDQPCDQTNDYCAKRLVSCELRHPEQVVPFGGFPGSVRYG